MSDSILCKGYLVVVASSTSKYKLASIYSIGKSKFTDDEREVFDVSYSYDLAVDVAAGRY